MDAKTMAFASRGSVEIWARRLPKVVRASRWSSTPATEPPARAHPLAPSGASVLASGFGELPGEPAYWAWKIWCYLQKRHTAQVPAVSTQNLPDLTDPRPKKRLLTAR